MSLRQLQENFQAYILQQDETILADIGTENVNVMERIDIYRQGYSLRLLDILEKDFPYFRKMLSSEAFQQLGHDYIKAYPSDNFNICKFSRNFSQFLLDQNHPPHWADMIAFEWALSGILDASDAPQIDVNELGQVAGESWPYIQFSFHPSVEIHGYYYNAPSIVYAYMFDNEPPALEHYETPQYWIIWRKDLCSYFESINAQQLWMFGAINEGKTFGEICEGLCQWLPEEEVAMFAAGTLRNWIERGLFSELRIAELAVCD